MQLVLGDFFARQVVIPVPLLVKMVLRVADIVAEAERSIVIHHAVQVVDGGVDGEHLAKEFLPVLRARRQPTMATEA